MKIINLCLLLTSLLFIQAYSSTSDTLTYKRPRKTYLNGSYLDVVSGAVRTIQSDHSHLHNYECYSYNHIDTLTAGKKSVVAMYTGTKEIHLKYVRVWAEKSPMKICIWFDPDTIRMSNDTLIPNNRNQDDNVRNILFSSVTTLTDSVDTMAGARNIDPSFFGGGSGLGGTSFAGESPSELEWIFPPNQYVIFCLDNLSGATSLVTTCIFWYEVNE